LTTIQLRDIVPFQDGLIKEECFSELSFHNPFTKQFMKAGGRIYEEQPIANHTNLKMIASFDGQQNEPLVIRVGISSVSYDGARENLKAEISHFDFDKVRQQTKDVWNDELSVIEIEADKSMKTIFYTSLYHTLIQPNNIADVNGDYINSTSEKRNAADKKHYSTFSLWDTYRAAHPLYTIIQPERTAGFINSMFRQYSDYGYLPIWQLWGKETYCMIGNHAIPVVVDAFNKNIKVWIMSLHGMQLMHLPESPTSMQHLTCSIIISTFLKINSHNQ
jgi:predicted alpha-1,2-mannosidase